MRLLRQLEFAFRTTDILSVGPQGVSPGELTKLVEQAPRLPTPSTASAAVALQLRGRDAALETRARQLLCSLGAKRIAAELRIEWNSRLQTAAGRADYRQKLVSLNPRLVDHPGEIDRTLRHELAHFVAQCRAGRRRIAPHGPEWQQACHELGIADEKRCHTLPFPAKRHTPRFVYRCPNCRRDFPRVRKLKRTVACLACCRAHNGGEFDVRFRLKIVS